MKHRRSLFICTIIAAVLLTTLACGLPSVVSNTGSTSPIRQWASSASASSEFGSSDWSAQQAVGEPNTAACGDQITAWASADYGAGVDWLTVDFATPVVPTQINIHESYTPGSIIKVDVIDTNSTIHTVWQGTPASVAQCPRVFVVNVSNVDSKVNSVVISVDQSVLADWDEIDAVELIGTP
jgi:hypothetical protein